MTSPDEWQPAFDHRVMDGSEMAHLIRDFDPRMGDFEGIEPGTERLNVLRCRDGPLRVVRRREELRHAVVVVGAEQRGAPADAVRRCGG